MKKFKIKSYTGTVHTKSEVLFYEKDIGSLSQNDIDLINYLLEDYR